jgi:hypothetical protein
MVVVCVEILVTKSLRDRDTRTLQNSLHDVIIEEKSYT